MSKLFLGFLDGIGSGELLLIFLVMLMLFGSERLPGVARGIGKAIREFKKATSGVEEEIRRAMDEAPPPIRKPVIPPVPFGPPPAAQPPVTPVPPDSPAPPPGPPAA